MSRTPLSMPPPGVKDVAKGGASNVAEEAKYQARSLVDQTRSELRGQASNQQSALADKLQGWASELGSMASKSDESGPMSDLLKRRPAASARFPTGSTIMSPLIYSMRSSGSPAAGRLLSWLSLPRPACWQAE